MKIIADFHIHSKYSRATSKDINLDNLARAAKQKGINLLGTGDFTHPAWYAHLRENLKEAEPGLFINKNNDNGTRFILTSEISCIFKKNDKVRKIELIINKINLDLLKKKEIISIQDIIEILGVKLIGVIPDNYKIIIASNVGKPIPFSKDKDLSSVFINIAKRLTGEKIPVTTLNSENDSKSENLWNKVKKTFERK